MRDLTLCTNNECPVSSRCRRKTSIPSIGTSSKMFEFTQNEKGIFCDKFRMIDDRDFTQKININGVVRYGNL